MKRILLVLLFCFCLCGVNDCVYAAESTESTETTESTEEDKVKYVTSGEVTFQEWNSYVKDGFTVDYIQRQFYTVLTCEDDGYMYYTHHVTGNYDVYNFVSSGTVSYSQSCVGDYDGDGEFGEPAISEGIMYPSNLSLVSYMVIGNDWFVTDLPIFERDDEEAIKNYVDSGDTSGATNSENFQYTDEYDETIPLPHNIRILQGVDQTKSGSKYEEISSFNHDVVITWEQDDVIDDLEFEIQGCTTAKRLSDSDYTNYTEHTGAFQTYVTNSYGGSTSMTVNLDKSTLNNHKEKGFLKKLVLRVRNKVGNKTSNWVSITIDIESQTATATEEGYEDNTDTGGDEYNDNDVNDDSKATDAASGTTNVSIDGIMGYIRSGFGLLGNGGIIALMAKVFLYLPANVWTIIYFFISMVVAICLIGVVKDVIF